MSNTLTTHTFTLDTRTRDMDTFPGTNEYRIALGGKSYNGVVAITLEYAGVPATERTIHDANNTLTYRVGDPGAMGPRRTVVVPGGMYATPTALVDEIQDQMTLHGDGMTVTYNDETQRLTFSAPTPFSIFTSDSSIRHILGIKTSTYVVVSAQQDETTHVYTPHGTVDVSGPRYIQLESPDLDDPVLGMIDLQKSPTEFVPRPERYFDTIKSKVSSLGIRLTTDGGRVYDTGAVDHFLVVKLTVLDTKQLKFNQQFDHL